MPVLRPSPARLAACVFIVVAALSSAGCRRNPPQPPRAARAQPESSVDAGAPVLAAVLNARAAIAAGDSLAAYNDANVGLRAAVGLAGAESALYPPPVAPPGYRSASGGQAGQGGAGGGGGRGGRGGGRRHRGGAGPPAAGQAAQPAPAPEPTPPPQAAAPKDGHGGHRGHGGHGGRGGGVPAAPGSPAGGKAGADAAQATAAPAPFTSFDAQVRLVSALAKLQAQDSAGADVDLAAVADAVQPGETPTYLPLIRASQSLALARAAVSGGRRGELRTQLTAAQTALEAYQGKPHAAEAKAIASAIGDAIRQPGALATLAPAQIALWAGVVGAWA